MSDSIGKCLEERAIGTLAIRILEEAGGDGLFEKGPPDEFPVGLFVDGEESVRTHLNICSRCRGRLFEEIEYFKSYCKTVDSVDAAAGFEKLWNRIGMVILRYVSSFEDSLYDAIPLAASTETPEEPPMIFSSEDGGIRLIEIVDPSSGASSYYLRSDDPAYVCSASVVIDGRTFDADGVGRIGFGDSPPAFGRNTRVTVVILLK